MVDASGVEGGEFGRLLWALGVGEVLAAVGSELLPVVFGVGERAVWDWSLIYVTSRFVLLPLFCAVHLLLVGVFLVLCRRKQSGASVLPAASAVVPLGYLLSLRLHPLPWFV